MNELTRYNSNSLQNDYAQSDSFSQADTRPNSNPLAFIFGEKVLRPAIDVSAKIACHVYDIMKTGLMSFDNDLSRMVNIFPVARANPTGLSSEMIDFIKLAGGPDLDSIIRLAIEEKKTRGINEIESTYGSLFLEIIGVETIYQFPKVTAKDLGLDDEGLKPSFVVEPFRLEGRSLVRGQVGSDLPFIAIALEVLNSAESQEIEKTVVDLVFDRPEENDGIDRDFKKSKLQALKKLIDGQSIFSRTSGKWIRKAKL